MPCRLSPAAALATGLAAALVAPWLPPAAAHPAAIDCTAPRTPMERLVCADVGLHARDELLARIFAGVRRHDPSDAGDAAQREWLAFAAACRTAACLLRSYDARIGALLRRPGGLDSAARFTADAPDGRTATLDVVGPVANFVAVSLTASGPGETAATADAVVQLWRGKGETAVNGCLLSFRTASDHWEVVQAGACALPDGTGFAGTYRR